MSGARPLTLGRRLVALAFLCIAYGFYAWSWNTVDILRPYIAESLKLSLPQAGALYSAQALGALAGSLVNGQLADRFGRRRALILVMIAFGLCLVWGGFVRSFAEVLTQRALMGYFMGSMFPITAGLYYGLFESRLRGRIAGLIFAAYNIAVALLGVASGAIFRAGLDWRWLLWAGVVPILAAPLALVFVPADEAQIPAAARARLPIAELFLPEHRNRTLRLALLTGLNFFAYQAFTGWATTFLKTVRHFDGSEIGTVVTWQFSANVVGSLMWGWFGDHFGRRPTAVGFLVGAGAILVFLFAPLSHLGLGLAAAAYGWAISCSVVWGPWLTELYPSHLRSTAASIFNWGRVISFMAPLITGVLAEHVGLAPTMTVASAAFVLAALVWLALPETLSRRQAAG